MAFSVARARRPQQSGNRAAADPAPTAVQQPANTLNPSILASNVGTKPTAQSFVAASGPAVGGSAALRDSPPDSARTITRGSSSDGSEDPWSSDIFWHYGVARYSAQDSPGLEPLHDPDADDTWAAKPPPPSTQTPFGAAPHTGQAYLQWSEPPASRPPPPPPQPAQNGVEESSASLRRPKPPLPGRLRMSHVRPNIAQPAGDAAPGVARRPASSLAPSLPQSHSRAPLRFLNPHDSLYSTTLPMRSPSMVTARDSLVLAAAAAAASRRPTSSTVEPASARSGFRHVRPSAIITRVSSIKSPDVARRRGRAPSDLKVSIKKPGRRSRCPCQLGSSAVALIVTASVLAALTLVLALVMNFKSQRTTTSAPSETDSSSQPFVVYNSSESAALSALRGRNLAGAVTGAGGFVVPVFAKLPVTVAVGLALLPGTTHSVLLEGWPGVSATDAGAAPGAVLDWDTLVSRPLQLPDNMFSATGAVLRDGTLAFLGGNNAEGSLDSGELSARVLNVTYDLTFATWRVFTDTIKSPRKYSSFEVLPNGKLLVLGGTANEPYPISTSAPSASAEIFPTDLTSSSISSLRIFNDAASGGAHPISAVLPSGRVFILTGNRSTVLSVSADGDHVAMPSYFVWGKTAHLPSSSGGTLSGGECVVPGDGGALGTAACDTAGGSLRSQNSTASDPTGESVLSGAVGTGAFALWPAPSSAGVTATSTRAMFSIVHSLTRLCVAPANGTNLLVNRF
ncbi:hypothetical protein HK405_005362 [Cladochytrium tenue]|nr:hypothetical protein HK405_005362 [Cladochytrium tenue]